jgi:hypothetical protein
MACFVSLIVGRCNSILYIGSGFCAFNQHIQDNGKSAKISFVSLNFHFLNKASASLRWRVAKAILPSQRKISDFNMCIRAANSSTDKGSRSCLTNIVSGSSRRSGMFSSLSMSCSVDWTAVAVNKF